MNKKELAAKVAKQTGQSVASAGRSIDAVFAAIRENVVEGNSTTIQGFGSFIVGNRAERLGINPATKLPIKIVARKVMKFRASKSIEIK